MPLPPVTSTPPSQRLARNAAQALEQLANSQMPSEGSNISKRRASIDHTPRNPSPEDPDEPEEGEAEEQTADEADLPNTLPLRTPIVPVVVPADTPARG